VAATPEAEVGASAPSPSAAASVEPAKPADGPAAAAEVGEPVSAAMVADAPATGPESAAQPDVSADDAVGGGALAASAAGDDVAPLVMKPIKSLAVLRTESALQPMSTAMRRHVIRCS
jgi:hypothetical protein